MRKIFLGLILAGSTVAFSLPGHVTKPIPVSEIGGGVIISDPGTTTSPNDVVLVRVHEDTGVAEMLNEDIQHSPQWVVMETISLQDERLADAVDLDTISGGTKQAVGTHYGPGDVILTQYYDPRFGGQFANPCVQQVPCVQVNPCVQTYNPCAAVAPQYYAAPAQPYAYAPPPVVRYAPRYYGGYNRFNDGNPYNDGYYRRPVIARPYGGYYARPYNVYRYPRPVRRW